VAFAADFAPQLGGFANVVLLVAALHNSWEMTPYHRWPVSKKGKPRGAAFL
jgi:hypothetical protein